MFQNKLYVTQICSTCTARKSTNCVCVCVCVCVRERERENNVKEYTCMGTNLDIYSLTNLIEEKETYDYVVCMGTDTHTTSSKFLQEVP